MGARLNTCTRTVAQIARYILVFRNHTEQNETKLDTYLINVTDEGQM